MIRRLLQFSILSFVVARGANSQTLTTGEITGTVTDQTAAVLPKVTVTLKNNKTGATQTTQTNGDGVYRFSFVAPSQYTVSANASGFQASSRVTQVNVGAASTVDFSVGAFDRHNHG